MGENLASGTSVVLDEDDMPPTELMLMMFACHQSSNLAVPASQ